jgi:hypothetical protein
MTPQEAERDYVAEYLALRAANDQLRERGKQWLWNALDTLCSELSREWAAKPGGAPLQVGRQEWQFHAGAATLVGERFGARLNERTLLVEAGWPRLPEHGFIPDGGLALGQIGLSQNTMIEARTVAELVLKKQAAADPVWHLTSHKTLGERLTESHLRSYLKLLLSD